MKKMLTVALGLALAQSGFATTYNDMYLSYVSPQVVKSVASYAQQNNINGYIMWTLEGDMPADDSASLLTALNSAAGNNHFIMGYWDDWGVYTNTALPSTAYPIPGSVNTSGAIQTNPDLAAKLDKIDAVAYAFLEAQAQNYGGKANPNSSQIGTLYFNDPWSDLTPTDSFCSNNPICTFVPQMKGQNFADAAKMGNFEAFANLPAAHPNLQTVISVGGYGHNDTFEDTFANAAYIDNFVTSAIDILNNYHIDGIDLDYEDPNMTQAQSQDFYNLVAALSKALPAGKYITVTVLANPAYLQGQANGANQGFAPGVLKNIASLDNVKKINLMTYDFHGAFDYDPSNPAESRTGFLSNVYMPNNAPSGYDPRFSIESSAQTLIQIIGSGYANKVGLGIPAYGRALANIDPSTSVNNTGLFGALTAQTLVPGGDQDTANCTNSINGGTCSGIFSYQYIVKNMIGKGFTATDWQNDTTSAYNGTTAFANTWSPASGANYTLEMTNTGSSANGDLGIILSVKDSAGDQFTSDYLGPDAAGDKIYNAGSNPSAASIEGKDNLTVYWQTYAGGPSGQCPNTFSLTQNTHVMVKVNSQGQGVCAIEAM